MSDRVKLRPVTREEVLESEFKHILTRDPEIFFEAMLLKVIPTADKPLQGPNFLKVQKAIFSRWFKQYEKDLTERIRNALIEERHKTNGDYKAGYSDGRIDTLSSLPIKKTLFGRIIDIHAVNALIRKHRK